MSRGKGIVLYSGGLDSLLAAKILIDQDIEIIGFHAILPFIPPHIDPENLNPSKLAAQINLPLHYYRCEKEYLEMVKNPPHGYGKHFNPCIDCKIHFIKKATEFMIEKNADFIATGEVVGQRPMSQMKHMLNHIEKVTDLKRRLLRPLSAKLLKPTLAEEQGIVNREKLFDINGRSRKRQMSLAKELGISEYSSPGGGCLFTDNFIAKIVKDLFDHHIEYTAIDLYLLTIGRNFRISDTAKVIVSRNENENNILEKYNYKSDYFFMPDFKGPVAHVKGKLSQNDIMLIAAIISRYGKPGTDSFDITILQNGDTFRKIQAPDPLTDNELEKMRI